MSKHLRSRLYIRHTFDAFFKTENNLNYFDAFFKTENNWNNFYAFFKIGKQFKFPNSFIKKENKWPINCQVFLKTETFSLMREEKNLLCHNLKYSQKPENLDRWERLAVADSIQVRRQFLEL